MFKYILNHNKLIIKSLFIGSIGLIIFLLQSFVGEGDYSNRMSVIFIDFSDKIFLIKYFFSNLLRTEVIIFIVISLSLFFYIKKTFNRKNNQINLFIIFIISSFLSTIFFILLSSKIISLYQFVNIFLFSFVLSILL